MIPIANEQRLLSCTIGVWESWALCKIQIRALSVLKKGKKNKRALQASLYPRQTRETSQHVLMPHYHKMMGYHCQSAPVAGVYSFHGSPWNVVIVGCKMSSLSAAAPPMADSKDDRWEVLEVWTLSGTYEHRSSQRPEGIGVPCVPQEGPADRIHHSYTCWGQDQTGQDKSLFWWVSGEIIQKAFSLPVFSGGPLVDIKRDLFWMHFLIDTYASTTHWRC